MAKAIQSLRRTGETSYGRFFQDRTILGYRREGPLDLLPATGLLRLQRLPGIGEPTRSTHGYPHDSGFVHLRALARVRPLPRGTAPGPRDSQHNASAPRWGLQLGVPA